jgi:hypothetical protein
LTSTLPQDHQQQGDMNHGEEEEEEKDGQEDVILRRPRIGAA